MRRGIEMPYPGESSPGVGLRHYSALGRLLGQVFLWGFFRVIDNPVWSLSSEFPTQDNTVLS